MILALQYVTLILFDSFTIKHNSRGSGIGIIGFGSGWIGIIGTIGIMGDGGIGGTGTGPGVGGPEIKIDQEL